MSMHLTLHKSIAIARSQAVDPEAVYEPGRDLASAPQSSELGGPQ